MRRLTKMLCRLQVWKDTKGQDMIEYALIGGFIAVAAATVMPGVKDAIISIFSSISSVLNTNASAIK